MSAPHLVIAAYWSTEPPAEATKRVADAIRPYCVEGSGAAVSIKHPDGALFEWLRAIDLAEAAGLPPWTPLDPSR